MEKGKKERQEIAYQNKDIVSKLLAEWLKGKSFRVYGLDIPDIRQVYPTNIPAVRVNELRLDNLFELMDDSVAIVDYESEYKNANKVKYLNYLTGIANRYLREKKECPLLRMIVIYTGDIVREKTSDEYDIGALKMRIESAFLSELDTEEIQRCIRQKIIKEERLTDEELMELIILPLAYREKEEKEKKIREAVNLASCIQDDSSQLFALGGILAFTDKVIDVKTADRIRRMIEMTKVERLIREEHRQEFAQLEERNRQMEEKARRTEEKARRAEEEMRRAEEEMRRAEEEMRRTEEEMRRAEEELRQAEESMKNAVIRMLDKGYPVEEVVSIWPEYSPEEIERLYLRKCEKKC